jgi:hypothetical protein
MRPASNTIAKSVTFAPSTSPVRSMLNQPNTAPCSTEYVGVRHRHSRRLTMLILGRGVTAGDSDHRLRAPHRSAAADPGSAGRAATGTRRRRARVGERAAPAAANRSTHRTSLRGRNPSTVGQSTADCGRFHDGYSHAHSPRRGRHLNPSEDHCSTTTRSELRIPLSRQLTCLALNRRSIFVAGN